MMRVIKSAGGSPSARADTTFTGEAWRDIILPDNNGFSVGNVFFTPYARTYWHSHPGGQLLIVMAGEGIVADANGPVSVTAGDMIWTPTDVRHWHGASAARYMIHTAVTLNGVDWEEAVTDDEFAAAQDQFNKSS